MEYVLMHKDIPVLSFIFSNQNRWVHIRDIFNEEHMPVNMLVQPQNLGAGLNSFIDHRFIPRSRSNYDVIKTLYKMENSFELSFRSHMVSISDHYWVKYLDDSVIWADVNFYDNPIPDEHLLIGSVDTLHQYDPWQRTPNTSNNGTLRQIWLHQGEEILLSKAGELTFKQEPFNESVVSDLLMYFSVPYISYSLGYMASEEENVSICSCFTNQDVEYIPAWQLTANQKPNHMSEYEHYIAQLGTFGLTDIRTQLEQMIALDYLIANEDRHWGNFGALRYSDSLEFVGLAPIFDNGNSLGYKAAHILRNKNANMSVAFNKTHSMELKHIKSPLHIDFGAIQRNIFDIVDKRFTELINPEFDKQRVEQIATFISERVDAIEHELY